MVPEWMHFGREGADISPYSSAKFYTKFVKKIRLLDRNT